MPWPSRVPNPVHAGRSIIGLAPRQRSDGAEMEVAPFEFDTRRTAIACASGLGVYSIFLSILTLNVFTSYDGVFLGVALTAIGAVGARQALLREGRKTLVGKFLCACRGLPLATRITAALGLFVIALLFDRYLDGDPRDYRLATFILPIMVGVILFDIKAALSVILASAVAIDYFLIPPIHEFTPARLSDGMDLAIYIGVCFQISLAVERFMSRDAGATHV